ncbi:MAG: diacylglycerol kinase (ATP) [Spirosomataceae bacterium]|jgi:diacylglycerol kinase (ATP)
MNLKKTLKSFKYAFQGIGDLARFENNFRVHLFVVVVVILSSVTLRINRKEWMIVVFLIGFVLTAEAFNTAIEKICDFIHPEFHPDIGKIKDLAAGGVLIAVLTAVVIGLIIFVPKLIALL